MLNALLCHFFSQGDTYSGDEDIYTHMHWHTHIICIVTSLSHVAAWSLRQNLMIDPSIFQMHIFCFIEVRSLGAIAICT